MRDNERVIAVLNSDYKVVVVYGGKKTIAKALKRRHWDRDAQEYARSSHTRGTTYWRPDRYPLIALPRKPKTNVELGTLAHEACHAVQHIFEFIQQEVGGEIFAHSVAAVVRGALK